MTKYPDLFADLAAAFEGHEIRTRKQGGRDLHYITARTAMNRLDSVLGPENWWDEYTPGENSVQCKLTIRLPDGTTLTKADAGGYAGMSDQGDDDKSGFSDAFKRAAVKIGVGRYLYRDGIPAFVREVDERREAEAAQAQAPAPARAPQEATGPTLDRWLRKSCDTRACELGAVISMVRDACNGSDWPRLVKDWSPEQARAGHVAALGIFRQLKNGGGEVPNEPAAVPEPAPATAPTPAPSNPQPPRSGRALFAWCKEMEQRHEVGMLRYINGWAKLQEFPGRMVDWDNDQVAAAYKEAVRKLQAVTPDRIAAYEEALAN